MKTQLQNFGHKKPLENQEVLLVTGTGFISPRCSEMDQGGEHKYNSKRFLKHL